MVSPLVIHAGATPTPIVEGRLYALGGNVEHDGRISWVPAAAPGLAPLNAYVVTEGTHGLMIDTSLPIVGDAVVEQLSQLGLEEIEILLTRPVEFDSMGNAELLVESFAVRRIHSERAFEPNDWIRFRADAQNPPPTFEDAVYEKDDDIEFAPGRTLTLVNAKLKLLACVWVFDHATGTLFTSDSFLHALASAPLARVVTAESDATTEADVVEHLTTKFAWLEGANTGPLRAFVNGVFDRFDVVTIAPNLGCVITGRDVVQRHRQMLDDGLRRLGGDDEEAA